MSELFDDRGRPKRRTVDNAGVDVFGLVTATPAVYTLLRRLKDLLTGIVLAAGTAVIGKVGHDITGIGDGLKVVATAASRVTLVAASTPAKVVIITAETDNTDYVVVGGSTVVALLATRQGTPLNAGDSITLLVDDLVDVYLDAVVSGEGVTFTYLT